jgi:membrane-associated protein
MAFLTDLIVSFGFFGVVAVIFAESGLFFGFFLPGDSLLVTVGLLASQGIFDITMLLPALAIAAILGDSVGYWTGHRFGKRLFAKKESVFFHKKNLDKAQKFYEKHGGKTIVLARFMPIIRTFAPIVAGIADMPYRSFLFYNIIGAMVWAVGMTLLGYFLGTVIPDVELYILPIIIIIIVASVLPAAIHAWRSPEHRKEFMEMADRMEYKLFKTKDGKPVKQEQKEKKKS